MHVCLRKDVTEFVRVQCDEALEGRKQQEKREEGEKEQDLPNQGKNSLSAFQLFLRRREKRGKSSEESENLKSWFMLRETMCCSLNLDYSLGSRC